MRQSQIEFLCTKVCLMARSMWYVILDLRLDKASLLNLYTLVLVLDASATLISCDIKNSVKDTRHEA